MSLPRNPGLTIRLLSGEEGETPHAVIEGPAHALRCVAQFLLDAADHEQDLGSATDWDDMMGPDGPGSSSFSAASDLALYVNLLREAREWVILAFGPSAPENPLAAMQTAAVDAGGTLVPTASPSRLFARFPQPDPLDGEDPDEDQGTVYYDRAWIYIAEKWLYPDDFAPAQWDALVELVGTEEPRFVVVEYRSPALVTAVVRQAARATPSVAVDNHHGMILSGETLTARLARDPAWEWWHVESS